MARKELIVPSGDFLGLLSEAKANAAAPRRPVSPAALDMACDPVSRALGPRLESLGNLGDGSGKGLPRTVLSAWALLSASAKPENTVQAVLLSLRAECLVAISRTLCYSQRG